MIYYLTTDELYHHGILGQKWGVRRFQNKDGTRTSAGKKRYYDMKPETKAKIKKAVKIGARVAGAALAAYGAYKVNTILKNDVQQKNLALASMAGMTKANQLLDVNFRPVKVGMGPMAENRYSVGLFTRDETRGPLASRITDQVYNDKGNQFSQLKRARQFKKMAEGKVTVDKIVDLDKYAKRAIADTKWNEVGQRFVEERLARQLWDMNNFSSSGVYRYMKN